MTQELENVEFIPDSNFKILIPARVPEVDSNILNPRNTWTDKDEYDKKANELKCIIYNQSDFDFAIQESKKVSENCLLYLQPEWGKKNEMVEKIINFMKDHPRFKLSIQNHKYLCLQ